MNRILNLVFTGLIYVSIYVCTYCQTKVATKEVTIDYNNGREVFQICETNPQIEFDDKKEYWWYTEFSKLKSTKGGTGGNLLHGNYKFYTTAGNLLQEKNYNLGLQDGNQKSWDSEGNVISTEKYSKGEQIYWKFKNEEGYVIEFNGPMLKAGTVRKVYNKYNELTIEETELEGLKHHVKEYYPSSGKVKVDFYEIFPFKDEDWYGSFTYYYENGKTELKGQYYDGDIPNIRTGTWTWYDSQGVVTSVEEYKVEITKWDNGEIKTIGSIYNMKTTNFTRDENDKPVTTITYDWVKTGSWWEFDSDGKRISKKEFDAGKEVVK